MNYTEKKILEQFFYNPMTKFGVRNLSKITGSDTKTVMKYLKELKRRGTIIKIKPPMKYAYYEANRHSIIYRYEKSQVIIKQIVESGLIEYLEKEINPKCIIIFGSIQKGTYHKQSDVDIFIQANYKKVDLEKFNSKIGHNISLFFEKHPKKLSKGLLTNIINGLVLSGQLELDL